MKNFITLFACACLGLGLLAGCASPDSGGARANSGSVAILFGVPNKAYSDICTVSTLKVQPSGQTWQSVLQQQAAARGADAVIVDTTTLNNSTTTTVSGKAIHYQ